LAVLVLNKKATDNSLGFLIDETLKAFAFPTLSETLLQIPDDPMQTPHVTRYTPAMAAANMAPQRLQ
jgi:hypothetical protein